ncbi:MAG: class I tRNA ligase family protein [Planctomycetota bacterium]
MSDEPRQSASHRYTAALANEIEPRWQARWAELGIDRQPNPGEAGFDASRPKFYCLDMFPYPSGAGLHVGHPEGYTATDIICRYKRMSGFNVLHPMGWDAFGLPAEQYAIQTGVHPAITTREAIDNFRRQLRRFGFCYDWSREFGTIDEGYYRWTQWVFLRLYKSWYDPEAEPRDATVRSPGRARPIAELEAEFASGARPVRFNPLAAEVADALKARTYESWDELDAGARRDVLDSYRLAYLGEQTVNWCPKLGTALANEEVIDGKSERGGFPVFRRPLRQWMLRITAYGDRLLADLEGLDWPESTLTQQREWIGRSEGAEIDFGLPEAPMGVGAAALRVYTTRPDTIFGATYMVVAPEHPLVDAVLKDDGAPGGLREYVEWARNRSDVERQESKDKTGCDTGLRAVNPATGERIPVWTSDYVLMGYGSGAIMAVPAHDQRDFEFAEKFGLPIQDVVYPKPLLAASRYFKRRPNAGEKWRAELSDVLSMVTSENTEPRDFDSIIERARVRSAGDETAPVTPVAEEWLGLLDGLAGDDAGGDGARDVIERGRVHRARGEAFAGDGRLWHSANAGISLNGLAVPEAKRQIVGWLESEGLGQKKVQFRLRDWLFSRQRYWGEPFPIVFDEAGRHHAVSDDALPVTLPEMTDYTPEESDEPKPLLAKAGAWLRTTAGEAGAEGLDPGAGVTRESNTMPGWAGSCWYHLRYTDPGNTDRLASEDAESYWMGRQPDRELGGVDLYVGGAEHAVLHLLYARFWHKTLFDLGHVSTNEPYRKLFHQGLILSHAFQRADKSLVPVDQVEERGEDEFVETATGERVAQIIAKMSKSLKNVVNPDDVIADHGADTFRLYEMYMGPLDQQKPWDTRAIEGMFRFLRDVWRLCIDDATGEPRVADAENGDLEKRLHRTVDKVGGDIERLAFNTAIAAMIEFKNAALSKDGTPTLTADQIDRFVRTLAPFAPHLSEEIWSRLGRFDQRGSVHRQAWPEVDESKLVDDSIEIPVQILGKLRSKVTVPADADKKAMETAALADERIKELIEGKTVRKVIVVPGRLVNLVVG